MSEYVEISPREFADYARSSASIWQASIGCQVSRIGYGKGTIERVDIEQGSKSLSIHVLFHDKSKCFNVEEFRNENLFYGMFVSTNVQIQIIQKQRTDQIKLRIEQEERARRKETEQETRIRQKQEEQRTEDLRRQEEKEERTQREAEKQVLLGKLRQHFKNDFLHTHAFYQSHCSTHITADEYEAEKAKFITSWVQHHIGNTPDFEQAAAIGAIEGHVQVVARAGSGKTTTLVNRAIFLQQHCEVAPTQMLLLAFNRKAAEEMRSRLTDTIKDVLPHVMTFHALAYALVHPQEGILVDEPDGEQSKSRALQSVIDDYLRTERGYAEIRALMMAHFRGEWERISSGGYEKPREDMLRYRRSLPRQAMNGMYVKSYGEKVIADFLFEHDIGHKYEHSFWWNGRNYRPDFTIFQGNNQGIVIEYFGLIGDPDYDESIRKKRWYWENKPGWHLIELSPNDFKDAGRTGLEQQLSQRLKKLGVKCERLSEDEIWNRIKDRAIDRFTKVVGTFVQRCRKRSLTAEQLGYITSNHTCTTKVEEQFLELAQVFYSLYLARLHATGEEDFDGLMQQAVAIVESGRTVFQRKTGGGDLNALRYILIDEFQDFSELFFRLIEAVRRQNPGIELFCVGDDWQAINGFAGSELSYYRDFGSLFRPARQLHMDTNYRSARSIVETGNALMDGRGQPSRAYKSAAGTVMVADLGTFEPTPQEMEDHPGDNLTPAVLRLVSRVIAENGHVVMLSRRNGLPWYVNHGERRSSGGASDLEAFLALIRAHLPEQDRKSVTISTVHKYKGLEKHTVIVLDAVARSYPLVHPDLMFTRVLGDTFETTVDEERRLFYVALTRAVERLFILTDKDDVSPFLEELCNKRPATSVDWSAYQPVVGSVRRITVRVGNQRGRGIDPTLAIKDLLKATGYDWTTTGWRAWWRTYPAESFTVERFIREAHWSADANGLEVRFSDDVDRVQAIYYVDGGQWHCVVNNIMDDESRFILSPTFGGRDPSAAASG